MDDYAVPPAGPRLRLLPDDPSEKHRLIKHDFYLPYKLSAELRQACHEQNITLSAAFRQMSARFVREHKANHETQPR